VCYHPNASLFIGNPGSRSFQDVRVIAVIRPSPCRSTSRIEVSSSHFEYNKPRPQRSPGHAWRSHPDLSFPSHFSSTSSSPPSMSFNRIHNNNAVAPQWSLSPLRADICRHDSKEQTVHHRRPQPKHTSISLALSTFRIYQSRRYHSHVNSVAIERPLKWKRN
jgi:hypothetical protein